MLESKRGKELCISSKKSRGRRTRNAGEHRSRNNNAPRELGSKNRRIRKDSRSSPCCSDGLTERKILKLLKLQCCSELSKDSGSTPLSRKLQGSQMAENSGCL